MGRRRRNRGSGASGAAAEAAPAASISAGSVVDGFVPAAREVGSPGGCPCDVSARIQKRREWVLVYKQNREYRVVQHLTNRPLTPDAERSGTMSFRQWELEVMEWRREVRKLAARCPPSF